MNVKILGAHNTESRNTKNMCLLVDDILALDAGGITSSLMFEDQMKIQVVLLTHHHYDHAKDLPGLAMNFFLRQKSFDLFTHRVASDHLLKYFFDGVIYPQFQMRPEGKPTFRLHIVEPLYETAILNYRVIAAPVNHSIPAVGYQVTDEKGKRLFYSGDTGRGLENLWQKLSPDVLFIEVTSSNRWEDAVRDNGHLTPSLLYKELQLFQKIRDYLPKVVCVHMNPESEDEIRAEIAWMAAALKADISLAEEGRTIDI